MLNSSESRLASELERMKKSLRTKDGVVKDWFGLVFPWEIFVGISAEKELQQMCEYEVVKDSRIGLVFLEGDFCGNFQQKKNFSRCVNMKLWKIDWLGWVFWGEIFVGIFSRNKHPKIIQQMCELIIIIVINNNCKCFIYFLQTGKTQWDLLHVLSLSGSKD